MKTIKNLFPFWLKKRVKIALRWLRDVRSGDSMRLAKGSKKAVLATFLFKIEEEQPFRRTAFWENKILNNRLAAAKIEAVEIGAGQIFSFWKIVGKPSAENGFRAGRTILNGKVEPDLGGGMCQLSGIIYLLALRSGMEILERWQHSVDLYTESERFAPLGSDATVFFGFKDLRFRNPFPMPVVFSFEATDENLTARLLAPVFFEDQKIEFLRTEMADGRRQVLTFSTSDFEEKKLLAESIYVVRPA